MAAEYVHIQSAGMPVVKRLFALSANTSTSDNGRSEVEIGPDQPIRSIRHTKDHLRRAGSVAVPLSQNRGLIRHFVPRVCIFCILTAKIALDIEGSLGDKFGGLAFLPLPNREPDRDGFLSEVLTGWKRSHSAQNFTMQTTKRRVASVMRLADFSGKYPWEWGPVDADELFDHLRGVENLALSTVRATRRT